MFEINKTSEDILSGLREPMWNIKNPPTINNNMVDVIKTKKFKDSIDTILSDFAMDLGVEPVPGLCEMRSFNKAIRRCIRRINRIIIKTTTKVGG